jgi:hypothetical protein
MNKKTKITLIVVLIAAVAVLYIQRDKLGLFKDFLSQPTAAGSSSDVVTLAEYQSLADGISYETAVSIIGAPGVESARNKIDGIPGVMETTITVMYTWQNKDGGNMNAMFQNNKLNQKAQFGLK